jgi:hypothetical protein
MVVDLSVAIAIERQQGIRGGHPGRRLPEIVAVDIPENRAILAKTRNFNSVALQIKYQRRGFIASRYPSFI